MSQETELLSMMLMTMIRSSLTHVFDRVTLEVSAVAETVRYRAKEHKAGD